MTMEESTIMPIPNPRPISVSILRLYPNIHIEAKVRSTDVGIEIPTMRVALKFLRNNRRITTAMMPPMRMLDATPSMDSCT
ncbi:Uncharacterised protein [Mycobacteroides abscessus subsp. abscessus]|nr:Uncharacterised protein [Mycobacteroides abscessus subsp. abscessus]